MTTPGETRQEARIVVKAEPLPREAFAPFGEVLVPDGLERLPTDIHGDRGSLARETDGEVWGASKSGFVGEEVTTTGGNDG